MYILLDKNKTDLYFFTLYMPIDILFLCSGYLCPLALINITKKILILLITLVY